VDLVIDHACQVFPLRRLVQRRDDVQQTTHLSHLPGKEI
jgi:hypothetical protein